MNTERLLILADYLEEVVAREPESFDMRVWWEQRPNYECGYAGCAIGHAARIPEFAEAGFHLSTAPITRNTPEFEDEQGFLAIGKFFDITSSEAYALFFRANYSGWNDPFEVAARIRELVTKTGS